MEKEEITKWKSEIKDLNLDKIPYPKQRNRIKWGIVIPVIFLILIIGAIGFAVVLNIDIPFINDNFKENNIQKEYISEEYSANEESKILSIIDIIPEYPEGNKTSLDNVFVKNSEPLCEGSFCSFSFEINNVLNKEIQLTPDNMKLWYIKMASSSNVRNFIYYQWASINKVRKIINIPQSCSLQANGKYENGSNILNLVCIPEQSTIENYIENEWKEVNLQNIILKANSNNKFKVVAEFAPVIGENSIDWKPALDNIDMGYLEPDWVLFNTTKNAYRNITFTNVLANTTDWGIAFINFNGTANVTIGFPFSVNQSGQNYSIGYQITPFRNLQLVGGAFTSENTEVPFHVYNQSIGMENMTRNYPASLANVSITIAGGRMDFGNKFISYQLSNDDGGVFSITEWRASPTGNITCLSNTNSNCNAVYNSVGNYLLGFDATVSCSINESNSVYKKLSCAGNTLTRGIINFNYTLYSGLPFMDMEYSTDATSVAGSNIFYNSDPWGGNEEYYYVDGVNRTATFSTTAQLVTNISSQIINGSGTIFLADYWVWRPYARTLGYGHTFKDAIFMNDDTAPGAYSANTYFKYRYGVLGAGDFPASDAGVRAKQLFDSYVSPPIITVSPEFSTTITQNIPTLTAGYPQINSTDGRNNSFIDLNAIFIATDVDNATLRYNVTWIMNNRSNFTTTMYNYPIGTLNVTVLNATNLSVGQTWRAMISLFDGVNITNANTSELLIVNSPPGIPVINYRINGFQTANYTIALSCTNSTDSEGDVITYQYYAEREINPPTINFANTTNNEANLTLGQDGSYFWRCRAFDSNNGTSGYNSTRTFSVDRRLITQVTNTFNSDVFQGTNQTFSTNVTINLTVARDINATLVNNTLILTTYKEQLENNKFRFTTSRLSPSIDTQYLWNFTILQNNNTIIYNTTHSFTQIISVHSLYDCTSGFTNSSSMLLMNYTLKNEENKTVLNGDWEGSFIRYFEDITFNTSFIFGLKQNVTNVKICSSPANASFKVDGTVRYQGLDPGTGIRLQDPRNYLFYRDNAGNNTGVLEIPLYLLDFAKANAIKFTLVDTSDVGIRNGIIKLQRYSSGNNTYETVAMGRTDQNGDTVIFLRLNDVTHKLIVVLPSGETKDYGDVVFSGSTYKITTTQVSPIKKLFDFDYVTTSITFTNSTKTFSASYTDTNPSTNERITSGCFAVTRLTSNQTDNVVYNRCTLATTGTFSVYIGNGSYEYNALLYANRNPSTILEQLYIDLTSNILGSNLGTEGVFFTFIITLSLVMLGLFKPEIAVAMSVLGIIISVMFGFFIMTYATLVAFVISAAMLIWRLSKR